MRLFLTILFSLGSSFAFAADLAVPSPLCKCDTLATDMVEGPSLLNFGPYAGQCVDTCKHRRSVAEREASGKAILLSNFLHDGKYWNAHVPVNAVEKVQVGFEEFMPGIFHVFLVFNFPDGNPLRLKSQTGARREAVRTLIISPEGIPPKEAKYNLIDAYMERYPIGFRTLSRDQMVATSVQKMKHKISLYELNISVEQSKQLLNESVTALNTKSFRTKYRLLADNCATNVLDFVDSVVQPPESAYAAWRWFQRIERALPIAGPLGTRKIFMDRGLISTGTLLN